MYCEDVVEAFEVVLHKGSVGHVYNFGEEGGRKCDYGRCETTENSSKGRVCFSKSFFFFVAVALLLLLLLLLYGRIEICSFVFAATPKI
jgi:hypothetical protein